ncbi:hypothetical protein FRB99_005082 [Tulasnella sp. 403]|nr:hypothetical protein FRB99_005082 [Tulasnella sp. 403]
MAECDICFIEYDSDAKRPACFGCGHVFCYRVQRKRNIDIVTKLFVDFKCDDKPTQDAPKVAPPPAEASSSRSTPSGPSSNVGRAVLQRLDAVSAQPLQNLAVTGAVVADARQWIEAQGNRGPDVKVFFTFSSHSPDSFLFYHPKQIVAPLAKALARTHLTLTQHTSTARDLQRLQEAHAQLRRCHEDTHRAHQEVERNLTQERARCNQLRHHFIRLQETYSREKTNLKQRLAECEATLKDVLEQKANTSELDALKSSNAKLIEALHRERMARSQSQRSIPSEVSTRYLPGLLLLKSPFRPTAVTARPAGSLHQERASLVEAVNRSNLSPGKPPFFYKLTGNEAGGSKSPSKNDLNKRVYGRVHSNMPQTKPGESSTHVNCAKGEPVSVPLTLKVPGRMGHMFNEHNHTTRGLDHGEDDEDHFGHRVAKSSPGVIDITNISSSPSVSSSKKRDRSNYVTSEVDFIEYVPRKRGRVEGSVSAKQQGKQRA